MSTQLFPQGEEGEKTWSFQAGNIPGYITGGRYQGVSDHSPCNGLLASGRQLRAEKGFRSILLLCLFPAKTSAEMWSLLVALLCFAWADAKHGGCFTAEELEKDPIPVQFRNWVSVLQHQDCVKLVPFLEIEHSSRPHQQRHHSPGCPDLTIQSMRSGELNNRSISPWTYYIDVDENRYPRQLAFAKCNCKGCIDSWTGRETTSLNSVEVTQKILVFRRKACPQDDGGVEKFYFEKNYIDLPIACTCAVPRYSN
ncbi:interleukin-17C [Erythrolamprus reginae]|uniref:interleukin-17C n=1 Tax=Erythrolamprus reginae TaxID=121349 RepID=UPI00396CF12E